MKVGDRIKFKSINRWIHATVTEVAPKLHERDLNIKVNPDKIFKHSRNKVALREKNCFQIVDIGDHTIYGNHIVPLTFSIHDNYHNGTIFQIDQYIKLDKTQMIELRRILNDMPL